MKCVISFQSIKNFFINDKRKHFYVSVVVTVASDCLFRYLNVFFLLAGSFAFYFIFVTFIVVVTVEIQWWALGAIVKRTYFLHLFGTKYVVNKQPSLQRSFENVAKLFIDRK